MEPALLRQIFEKFISRHGVSNRNASPITKADFFADGLTGREGSAAMRNTLCAHLSLPKDMTPTALLAAVNMLLDRTEYQAQIASIQKG